jgi:ribose 5-phosphate isomerase B
MATKETIAIVSDKSGFPLKEAVTEYLKNRDDVEVLDFGLYSADENEPYPVQAPKVAKAIKDGRAHRGVAICGTGRGMGIVCNKYQGVYAVVADTVFAASKGRIINNANVVTMGGWITAPKLGVDIVASWLDLAFTETMEERAEWLKNAYGMVQKIEEENFGS